MIQPRGRHCPDPSQTSQGPLSPHVPRSRKSTPVPAGPTPTRKLPQVLGASLLLAGWAMAGAVQAQSFDSVVVFGDSSSDPGNLASFQNQPLPLSSSLRYPHGTNFSTNPDWVWVQYLEQVYGGSGQYQPTESGGTNYAFGGAFITTNAPSLSMPNQSLDQRLQNERLFIGNQMRVHFSGPNRDQANPNALYVIWGGGNDLGLVGSQGALTRARKALEPGNNIPPVMIETVTETLTKDLLNLEQKAITAASDYLKQIQYLQEKGARNVVVLNLPPFGDTPDALFIDEKLSDIPVKDRVNDNSSMKFHQTLVGGLSTLDHGVIAIDVQGLFQEITRDPGKYGFQNITEAACTGTRLPLPFDDACGPANSEYPHKYKPNTNNTYLFADNVHPSGAAHRMLANVVTSTLSAPVQVSLAGEGALSVARVHRQAVTRRGSTTIPLDGTNLQLWAAGALAQEDQDALPTLGSNSADLNVVTLGVSRDWDGGVSVGAAVSFGNHHNTTQGASLDSAATLWSVDGQWQRGPLQLTGGLTLGSTAVDIERSIVLGPAQRMEQGSTTVSHFGGNLDLNYTLPNSGNHLRHGLSAGLDWINQDTDGYREGGGRSTAMNFAKFSRRSLTVRAGYGIEAAHNLGGIPLRPFARVGYERELETDPVRVSAGVNSMPGAQFSLDGLKPAADTAVLAVGAVADVHEHMEARLGYTFRTGDQARRSHQVELGLDLKL